MTLQQGLAFGLVGLTVAAFIWGRFRYDLVALAALVAGLAIGVIPADAAFEGFRVVRRHPIVAVAWGLVYLAVYVAMFGLGADKWASLMAAGEALEQSANPSMADFQALGQVYAGALAWAAPAGLLIAKNTPGSSTVAATIAMIATNDSSSMPP